MFLFRKRLVTCPDNKQTAAVSGIRRLTKCSRWPERAGCDQDCLAQIEASPQDCLVATIVKAWYTGKTCVICKRAIETPAAVIAPDGLTREWSEFAPQDLPRVFATHQPLCWQCNNVEELARLRPDVVTRRHYPAPEPEPPLRSDAVY